MKKDIRMAPIKSKPGLFTGQDCCIGDEVTFEAVVNSSRPIDSNKGIPLID